MSRMRIVPGDPEVWRIFQGQLYLFARPVGGEVFDEDPVTMIVAAQAHWATLE